MAKQSPSLYSVSKTFVWFAIVSIILTASLVAVVLLDHHREWKQWQKKFIALKVQKAKEELKSATASIDKKKLAESEKKLTDATAAFKTKKAQFDKLQGEQSAAMSRLAKVKAEYQNLKQYEDSYKYYLEEYRLHKDPKASEMESKLKTLSPKVSALKDAQDGVEKEIADKGEALAALKSDQTQAQKALDALTEEKTRIEKRIERIKPTLAKDILNAPMVDFVAPSIKVQQIVLENLQDDYHFAKVAKVDRCTTCHMGIDQKGYENAPQPFRTHPNLELYLGSASPHAIEKFGCTSCHGGSGQALSFIESAHTPRDENQEKEWVKKYGWHEMHHWENKMLPKPFTQASCVKCHQGVVEVPQAPKLNQGRKLAAELGCLNCHKVKSFESHWKVGPDLRNVKGKLTEEWVAKWLDNPKDFRESTRMPRVFHLSNTSSPQDKARNDASIHAITAYLLANSGEAALAKPPVQGVAAQGEKWVKELGCLGCHSLKDTKAGAYAPELSGLGSKVSEEWLYSWLKDPKHVSPGTRMPNLRLSDQEAADITAYLLTLKNDAFEAKAAPRAQMEVVDSLILESLQGTLRRSEAEAELKKMSGEDKLQFLGKKAIGHQGCFSCHDIKGFETTNAIGAELSDEGRKDIHKFDFGFTDIPQTRHDWILQKLKEPRVFDQGKIRTYYEKLRMPQFNLTDEEREDLTTFVLSLSEEQIPVEMQKTLDLREARVEKGRWLVKKLNCQGCHTLDGTEGVLRKITEDQGQAPPVLDGEGAKVQEKWLHHFLGAPTVIRPWFHYRMPTFGLNDEELDTLVYYFHDVANQKMTFADDVLPASDAETLAAGKTLFDTFQCAKCHQVTAESSAMGSSFLAPDLKLTRQRLKSDWVKNWLRDPGALQTGTMMPTFFADGQSPMPDILGGDAEKQIAAIRDYLYRLEASPEAEPKTKKT